MPLLIEIPRILRGIIEDRFFGRFSARGKSSIADVGVLVRGVIVDDQVHLTPAGVSRLIFVEETDELLMLVAADALADDLAVEHVECGEQDPCVVTLVIVGHCAAAATLHRQSRLGAVQCLDLRLLIDRQHQRVLRRIDVKADDILHLRGKFRIARQLEGAHPMRFQAVRPSPCRSSASLRPAARPTSSRPRARSSPPSAASCRRVASRRAAAHRPPRP
jgi:hypothetical protein